MIKIVITDPPPKPELRLSAVHRFKTGETLVKVQLVNKQLDTLHEALWKLRPGVVMSQLCLELEQWLKNASGPDRTLSIVKKFQYEWPFLDRN